MESLILGNIVALGAWRYILLFFGMMVEGDIVLFAGGFLISQGYFDLGLSVVLMFLGTVLGDMLWYWWGRWLKDSTRLPVRLFKKLARPLDLQLHHFPFMTLLFSKFSIGIHRSIVFHVGSVQPPRKFLFLNTVASAIWVVCVGGLGYLSGAYFQSIKGYVRYAEVGFLVGLVLFVVVTHYIARRSRQRIEHANV